MSDSLKHFSLETQKDICAVPQTRFVPPNAAPHGFHAPMPQFFPQFYLVSLYAMPPLLPITTEYDPYQTILVIPPPVSEVQQFAKTPTPSETETETKEPTPFNDLASLVGLTSHEEEEKKAEPKCPSSHPVAKRKKEKVRLQDTPRFRFKQDLIEKTLKELHAMFAGRVLPDDKALRGPTTVRLHVKTETSILAIVECMTKVSKLPGVLITDISTPISMKNRYQKKGFLCYFRISDESLVSAVLKFVKSNFVCFERCKIALTRASIAAAASEPINVSKLSINVSKLPIASFMNRQDSVGA